MALLQLTKIKFTGRFLGNGSVVASAINADSFP